MQLDEGTIVSIVSAIVFCVGYVLGWMGHRSWDRTSEPPMTLLGIRGGRSEKPDEYTTFTEMFWYYVSETTNDYRIHGSNGTISGKFPSDKLISNKLKYLIELHTPWVHNEDI